MERKYLLCINKKRQSSIAIAIRLCQQKGGLTVNCDHLPYPPVKLVVLAKS